VSVLADNALLGAFAAGIKPVSTGIVRDICEDFNLRAPLQPQPAAERSATAVPESAPAPSSRTAPEAAAVAESAAPFGFVTRRRRFFGI
jgi:hypothetical protein